MLITRKQIRDYILNMINESIISKESFKEFFEGNLSKIMTKRTIVINQQNLQSTANNPSLPNIHQLFDMTLGPKIMAHANDQSALSQKISDAIATQTVSTISKVDDATFRATKGLGPAGDTTGYAIEQTVSSNKDVYEFDISSNNPDARLKQETLLGAFINSNNSNLGNFMEQFSEDILIPQYGTGIYPGATSVWNTNGYRGYPTNFPSIDLYVGNNPMDITAAATVNSISPNNNSQNKTIPGYFISAKMTSTSKHYTKVETHAIFSLFYVLVEKSNGFPPNFVAGLEQKFDQKIGRGNSLSINYGFAYSGLKSSMNALQAPITAGAATVMQPLLAFEYEVAINVTAFNDLFKAHVDNAAAGNSLFRGAGSLKNLTKISATLPSFETPGMFYGPDEGENTAQPFFKKKKISDLKELTNEINQRVEQMTSVGVNDNSYFSVVRYLYQAALTSSELTTWYSVLDADIFKEGGRGGLNYLTQKGSNPPEKLNITGLNNAGHSNKNGVMKERARWLNAQIQNFESSNRAEIKNFLKSLFASSLSITLKDIPGEVEIEGTQQARKNSAGSPIVSEDSAPFVDCYLTTPKPIKLAYDDGWKLFREDGSVIAPLTDKSQTQHAETWTGANQLLFKGAGVTNLLCTFFIAKPTLGAFNYVAAIQRAKKTEEEFIKAFEKDLSVSLYNAISPFLKVDLPTTLQSLTPSGPMKIKKQGKDISADSDLSKLPFDTTKDQTFGRASSIVASIANALKEKMSTYKIEGIYEKLAFSFIETIEGSVLNHMVPLEFQSAQGIKQAELSSTMPLNTLNDTLAIRSKAVKTVSATYIAKSVQELSKHHEPPGSEEDSQLRGSLLAVLTVSGDVDFENILKGQLDANKPQNYNPPPAWSVLVTGTRFMQENKNAKSIASYFGSVFALIKFFQIYEDKLSFEKLKAIIKSIEITIFKQTSELESINLSTDVIVNEPDTLDDLGTPEKEGEAQGVFDSVKGKLGSIATGAIDYVKDMFGKGKKTLDDLIALPPQPSAALTESEKLAYRLIIKEAKRRKKQILIEKNNRVYINILKEILKHSK